MAIDVLGGATNLSHRIRLHTEALCKVHVLLDDDQAGKNAYGKAKQEASIDTDSINFTTVGGKTEAELEDLYNKGIYEQLVRSETGLELVDQAPDSAKKWSDRVRNLLRRAGKPFDDATIMAMKIKVAQSAAAVGSGAIHSSKAGPITSLINSVKQKLAV
jgi:putative ATP-dependent endonuclease of OLD family